ncbi:monooxygenase family protein [Kocuria sp. NPDC057446]|uniref:monooxygenase family protein n=1 Tax=Kocuria sp. NPDC057446 TaxID=3346137 RepID=UPI0036AED2AE
MVFLIGWRITTPRRVRQGWPVLGAMPPMLEELSLDPDSGLMGMGRPSARAARRSSSTGT